MVIANKTTPSSSFALSSNSPVTSVTTTNQQVNELKCFKIYLEGIM